jgi:hypothetical protein
MHALGGELDRGVAGRDLASYPLYEKSLPRWKSVKNKCLAQAAFTPSEAFNCGKNFGLHGPAPPSGCLAGRGLGKHAWQNPGPLRGGHGEGSVSHRRSSGVYFSSHRCSRGRDTDGEQPPGKWRNGSGHAGYAADGRWQKAADCRNQPLAASRQSHRPRFGRSRGVGAGNDRESQAILQKVPGGCGVITRARLPFSA